MRILFVVPYVPSLIRTRSYNLIRALQGLGCAITLATLSETDRDTAHIATLRSWGVTVDAVPLPKSQIILNLAQAAFSPLPLQASFSWSPAFVQLLQRLLGTHPHKQFDIIHVEHLRAARYALWLQQYLKQFSPRVPVVWDSVDSISYLFSQAAQEKRAGRRRWMARLELPRTRAAEARLVAAFDRVLVTSEKDADALRALATEFGTVARPLSVIPNGVDLSFFCPNFQIQRKPKTVLMTGKMSYHANTSAALYLLNEIMPLVWAQQPEAQLQLVGSSPPKALQAFAQRDPQRVQVTGFVPELQPYLWQATVAVVPILYGAGSQFKVLEALATATPTVVSPQAGNALSAQPGVDLLQAATPTEFAAAILQVFDKRELQQQLAQNGRQYVQAAHDWQAIAQQLLEIYHDTFRSVI